MVQGMTRMMMMMMILGLCLMLLEMGETRRPRERRGQRRLVSRQGGKLGLELIQAFSTVLPHEKLYLEHLPSANRYYKSFMHRDQINFVTMTKCVHHYPITVPPCSP